MDILVFVTFFFSEAAVVSLNFAEEQPGRSPHRTRKNTEDSPLVSKSESQ